MKLQIKFTRASVSVLCCLSFFVLSHANAQFNTTEKLTQLKYRISIESIGFSDIKKLYSSDSLHLKKSFFESATIEENSISIYSLIEITEIQKQNDTFLYCYKLLNPQITFQQQNTFINIEKIKAELGTPFFVTRLNSGKVIFVQTKKEISKIASGIQKEMTSNLQLIQNKDNSLQWNEIEDILNGKIATSYVAVKNENKSTTITKTAKKFLKYNSRNKDISGEIDLDGIFFMNKTGVIDSCALFVAETAKLKNDTLSAIGKKVNITLVENKTIHNDSAIELLQLIRMPEYQNKQTLDYTETDEDIIISAYAGTLGNDNWESLQPLLNKKLSEEETKNLVLKLRALFYLFPINCTTAVHYILDSLSNSFPYKIITTALGITDSHAACDAISYLIKKRLYSDSSVVDLFPALATHSFPTKEAAAFMMKTAFDKHQSIDPFIISTAQLTIAAMANKFAKTDQLYSNQLIYKIIKQMDGDADTLQHILVLSNTQSPLTIDFFEKQLRQPNTSIALKIEILNALNNIEGKRVDIILSEFQNDNDPEIQRTVRSIIENRKSKSN